MAQFNQLGRRAVLLFDDIVHSPNLAALWPLNEKSGSVLDRCTLNRLDGTVQGNPAYSKVIAGGFFGLDLDGTGDYVDFGNVSALNFERTDSFSGLAIIVPSITVLGAMVSKRTTPGWEWGLDATIKPFVRLLNTATTNELRETATAALVNATVYMLGFSYDGSSSSTGLILYKNGAADPTTINSNTLSASIQNAVAAQIGARGGSDNLNGDIAFVAIWKAVKSAQDFRRWAYLGGLL